jgi:parvulin-like peptidyl-prolyl isomerase
MVYFILGIVLAVIISLLIRKARLNKLIDKERELIVKLKEQQRVSAESEASYEEAKNKFRDIANKHTSQSSSKL